MKKFFTAVILALDFQLSKTILSAKPAFSTSKAKNRKGVPP